MSYKVVYTSNFQKEIKSLAKIYKSIKHDLEKLIGQLEANPKLGTFLGRECYKIRMSISAKGKGKSGGARVITHLFVAGNVVCLLSVFDKSSKDSISDKELEALLQQLL